MEKMRLIVLVDMPEQTRHERKVRRELLELLFTSGFAVLQAGTYTRVTDGRDSASAYERHLRAHAPDVGTVRVFTMTEAQFRNADLVAGCENAQEIEIGSRLDIFL